MPNREQGDWWKRSLTLVSGCNWPPGERPEECRNCYAEPMCERFPAIHAEPGIGDTRITGPFDVVHTHPERLAWLKPTGAAKIWLCSIAGDLFHPDVHQYFIHKALAHITDVNLIRRAHGREPHRVAILTKRYERAVNSVRGFLRGRPWLEGFDFLLMPSAGTQDSVDRACAAMAKLPEGIRWGLHCEPLLEELDLDEWLPEHSDWCKEYGHEHDENSGPARTCMRCSRDFDRNYPGWIVCGGETNVRNRRAARLCRPDWVRGIRDQCEAAGVPFFFKSWGEWMPVNFGEGRKDELFVGMECVGKARAGRILDGRTHDEMPEGWEVNE